MFVKIACGRGCGGQGSGGARFQEGFENVGRQASGGSMRPAVLNEPARHERFGRLLDPLVNQRANFAAEIGGVVEPAKLKAFEGSGGGFPQVLKIRQHSLRSHV